MKKLLLLFILPLFAFNNTTQNISLVGKWTGEDQNEVGIIIFDNEGYASFEINGETFGGKNFEIGSEQGQMTYTVDATRNPIEINMVIKKLATGEEKTLLCIAEFIDQDTLNFAMSYTDKRPSDFAGSESINLKRVR